MFMWNQPSAPDKHQQLWGAKGIWNSLVWFAVKQLTRRAPVALQGWVCFRINHGNKLFHDLRKANVWIVSRPCYSGRFICEIPNVFGRGLGQQYWLFCLLGEQQFLESVGKISWTGLTNLFWLRTGKTKWREPKLERTGVDAKCSKEGFRWCKSITIWLLRNYWQ